MPYEGAENKKGMDNANVWAAGEETEPTEQQLKERRENRWASGKTGYSLPARVASWHVMLDGMLRRGPYTLLNFVQTRSRPCEKTYRRSRQDLS